MQYSVFRVCCPRTSSVIEPPPFKGCNRVEILTVSVAAAKALGNAAMEHQI